MNIVCQIRWSHVNTGEMKICPDDNEPTETRELPYTLSGQFLERPDVEVRSVIFMFCESNPVQQTYR